MAQYWLRPSPRVKMDENVYVAHDLAGFQLVGGVNAPDGDGSTLTRSDFNWWKPREMFLLHFPFGDRRPHC